MGFKILIFYVVRVFDRIYCGKWYIYRIISICGVLVCKKIYLVYIIIIYFKIREWLVVFYYVFFNEIMW